MRTLKLTLVLSLLALVSCNKEVLMPPPPASSYVSELRKSEVRTDYVDPKGMIRDFSVISDANWEMYLDFTDNRSGEFIIHRKAYENGTLVEDTVFAIPFTWRWVTYDEYTKIGTRKRNPEKIIFLTFSSSAPPVSFPYGYGEYATISMKQFDGYYDVDPVIPGLVPGIYESAAIDMRMDGAWPQYEPLPGMYRMQ